VYCRRYGRQLAAVSTGGLVAARAMVAAGEQQDEQEHDEGEGDDA
jgi:hypothetical protein